MRSFHLLLSLSLLFTFNFLNAQSNCATALTVDPCNNSATVYNIAGNDAGFNLAGCDLDGDDAVWISFTVMTLATEVTITLSDWGGCGAFCFTDVTGAFYSGSCGALTAIDDCIDMTTGFSNGTNLGPFTFPVTLNETYYFRLSEENNDGGFAELLFEYDDCLEPLPVSLVSFEGLAEEAGNFISWETETEEDTEFHILERSFNGKENWNEIGRVDAAGFSTTTKTYDLLDKNPMSQSYYRLVSKDFSGHVSYSDVIVIERDLLKNSIDRIYPNPTTSTINVQFSTPKNEEVFIEVFDMKGVLIHFEAYSSHIGTNEWTYDMNDLVDGMYMVRLKTLTDQFNRTVVLKR